MSYWDYHGWLLLFGLAVFPRITTLLCIATPFGWLAWLGWIFTPHILVAVLATMKYGEANPLLVAISWIVALSGTASEASFSRRRKP